MNTQDAYQSLLCHYRETAHLESISSLLSWDQRTFLPVKAHAYRAEQLAFLAGLLHERGSSPVIGERLALIEGTVLVADPVSPPAVNVREWRRSYDRTVRIPRRLAEELARTTSECETVWESARKENDWQRFRPKLAAVLKLLVEKAKAIGYADEPYDVLLDDYEPGATAASLETLFGALRAPLVDLLDRIGASSTKPDTGLVHRHFPVEAQERFGRRIARQIGYDLDAGRIDVTAHPFTIGIGPSDIRITTRYIEDYFPAALFGTIHEAGHAMYEQGLEAEHWGSPMGKPISLGVHESQSRLWENFVGRSHGFWRYAWPLAKAAFPVLHDADPREFVNAVNAVQPSLIRVEADEVTYNLHILLRFDLELLLLRGDLSVDDLPDAWNDKMKAYLGLVPPDMASGVMQDVHWSAGLVGYFPTYTLGNLYAAQLYAKAAEEIGDLEHRFEKGEFAMLLEWLREKVHRHGCRFLPHDLIRNATGSPPDPAFLIRYLGDKFSDFYP